MVKTIWASLAAAGLLAGGAIVGTLPISSFGATPSRAAIEAAIDHMKPALVRIQVVSSEYREGREVKQQAVGSGAIITKDGYLITNHHVAGHATRIICTLSNHEEIEAELIGTDALTDVAVLKLLPAKPRTFPFARFADSSKVMVGDAVLAMGSPMALSQSVTLGIMSNIEMVMPRMFGSQFQLDGENVGSLVRWFAHDAAIYGGNSGGPLVDLKGDIVGINEISFGLSGAIPGNLARSVADELIQHGRVKRSWLGLDVQPLFKHSNGERGVLISGVVEGSPAGKAGLQAGDVLLKLADKPVNVKFDEQMPEFMHLVTSLPLDKEVTANVLRAGKEMSFQMTAIERGELNPKERELKQWGLTVRNISFLRSVELKRTNQLGVIVTSQRPGGPAGDAKPAIEAGDILTKVNGEQVKDIASLVELTKKLTADKTERVAVLATFEREARQFLTVVKLGLEEMQNPGLEARKAWLPVQTQVISRDIAAQMGQPDMKGFYITEVYPGTSAEKAGLKNGDFIVALDNEKLTAASTEHQDELETLIRQYDIGAKVELSIVRDKKPMKVTVELAQSPIAARELKKYKNNDFEFTARDISFFDVAEERWATSQKGVLVEDMKSGSWAELGGLGVEDLITEVDGQPVRDVDSLKRIMEQVAKEKRAYVIMKVLRGVHTVFLELEPAWK